MNSNQSLQSLLETNCNFQHRNSSRCMKYHGQCITMIYNRDTEGSERKLDGRCTIRGEGIDRLRSYWYGTALTESWASQL